MRWILRERVFDERRFGAARRHEDLHLHDLVLAELLDDRIRERLSRVGEHLAAVRIDDVHGDLTARRPLSALDRVHFVAQVHLLV